MKFRALGGGGVPQPGLRPLMSGGDVRQLDILSTAAEVREALATLAALTSSEPGGF